MTLTFDRSAYGILIAEVAPKVIETEEEYNQALVVAERLTFAKELTPEESVLLQLLVLLIETYEAAHCPMEQPTPQEVLQHIMEVSGTRQSDLVGIVGSSGVVSEIVNGRRSISKAQAKALGEYFKVSPSLFI
jgi:HTH-type transcriptional regulator / antitoxin HigA